MNLHHQAARHHEPEEATSPEEVQRTYLHALQLLERLHRLMLDLVKDDFERMGQRDLTPVQGMILYNLGGQNVSAGELRSRGMYQGSNVSYNLKKLVEMGYIHHERSSMDRRSVRVSLTERGNQVRDRIEALFRQHADLLAESGVLDDPPQKLVNHQWQRIERFWSDQIRFIY